MEKTLAHVLVTGGEEGLFVGFGRAGAPQGEAAQGFTIKGIERTSRDICDQQKNWAAATDLVAEQGETRSQSRRGLGSDLLRVSGALCLVSSHVAPAESVTARERCVLVLRAPGYVPPEPFERAHGGAGGDTAHAGQSHEKAH